MRIEALEGRLLLSAGLFSSDQDIGSPAQAGSASYSNGVYTVAAGGTGAYGTTDQFHFTDESFSGDGVILAKLNSLTNAGSGAQAGVMFRNGTAPTAAFAEIELNPANQIAFNYRSSDGGTAAQTTVVGVSPPRFIELTRSGTTMTALYSSDGVTWTSLGSSQTIGLGTSALVGLAVASGNGSTTTTATYSSVSVVPAGWSDNDIGSPTPPGSAGYDSTANTFLDNGGGSGIGGTADQFNFANHAITGDSSVTALIDSVTNTDPPAKAGVMIRADTTAGSMFATADVSASNTVSLAWRGATGGSIVTSPSIAVSVPVWLKLTDTANNFTGSYSSDGMHWTQIAAATSIPMPSATALAGIWVSAHNSSSLNTAAFSEVSVARGGWSDGDIGSPAIGGSAVYDAPSDTYTIAGNGSDIWGAADQFNFASTSMNGDGSAIAYVDAVGNTDPWAKAGVMIRNDSTAGSAFAAVLVSPSNGISFEWRAAAGGTTKQEINSPPIAAPVGLKLTRAGNTFTAYYSADGINWVQIGPSQSASVTTSGALAGLAVTSHNPGALCTATFSSVGIGTALPPGAGVYSATDQLFLNDLENRQVQFFYDETNSSTGLVPDGALANGGSNGSASSIASLGFGLTALTIGDQRGWLSHANAYQRALTTVNFLYNTAAQVNGFYYHFLNPVTGARSPGSEVSSVDTAELMAGVLDVAQYWAGTPAAQVALNIFNRVNWPWMQKANGQFYGAWVPENSGVFSGGYGDFSEAVLLYLLALGSPTHPISRSSWTSWSRTPAVTYAGMTFVTADDAALFTVQYPQAWFDLRGLTDSAGLSYYPNAQTATLAQRQWMSDLSSTFSDFGPNMWGLTPSDSANGYTVWGGPPANGPIDGTVVPTGPGGSLEFVPRQAIDALEYMYQTYGATNYRKYGFVDAFNPLTNWTSSIVLGIDTGMTLIAAENSRSNFVWNIFNQNSAARQSLASAFPSLTPSLLSAASRKTRPDSIVIDDPVSLSGGLSVEPRVGGPTQLVLTFGASIVKGSNFAVTLGGSGGGSDGIVSSTSVSGSTLTINLSGTIDAQTLVVNVTDVRNFSTSASGNYTLSLGVLLGDASHDGNVNALDFNALATNFGLSVSSDMQGDFNYDGVVDSLDFDSLAMNYGKTLALASGGISTGPLFVLESSETAKTIFSGSSIGRFADMAENDDNDDAIGALLDQDRNGII